MLARSVGAARVSHERIHQRTRLTARGRLILIADGSARWLAEGVFARFSQWRGLYVHRGPVAEARDDASAEHDCWGGCWSLATFSSPCARPADVAGRDPVSYERHTQPAGPWRTTHVRPKRPPSPHGLVGVAQQRIRERSRGRIRGPGRRSRPSLSRRSSRFSRRRGLRTTTWRRSPRSTRGVTDASRSGRSDS